MFVPFSLLAIPLLAIWPFRCLFLSHALLNYGIRQITVYKRVKTLLPEMFWRGDLTIRLTPFGGVLLHNNTRLGRVNRVRVFPMWLSFNEYQHYIFLSPLSADAH